VPPSALAGPAAEARSRLAAEIPVDAAFLGRLAAVCDRVDTSIEGRVAAGRDWWPLTVTWAGKGTVPAIAAAVATPTSTVELAAVMALCHDAGVPVTPVAGRSGVGGGSVPAFGGVSLDLTGLAGILAVDDTDLLVDLAAGTWGDEAEGVLRRDHGLTLGHWPQSISISTVGGWVACRGAGQYSTRYGKIEDLVAGLEVVLADGRVIRTGSGAPRAATGPDLHGLFVGSEGTLGVITEVRLRAHPLPPCERHGAWAFAEFAAGLDACRRILRRGATPAVLRLYDATESARHFDGTAGHVLIVVDEGDEVIVDAAMRVVADECAAATRLDAGLAAHWLERRNQVASLESLAAAGIVADTIEVAASWRALPDLYADAVRAVQAVDGTLAVSAHQSHAYPDGACVYFSFGGRPGAPGGGPDAGTTPAEAYYRAVWDAVMAVTRRHGGAISHHHGIGINRARYLREAWGPAFDVLVAVKDALDPKGILNPGKLDLPSPYGTLPWP
jgi:alkyldihydroxyacetonephosphate synthase